jgi:hypothetical protein
MKRRDFLRLQSAGSQQIATLSCERLFMCYADSSVRQEGRAGLLPEGEDWWACEPPRQVDRLSVEQLFHEIGQEIAGADVLVLKDREWLQDDEFGRHVEQLLGNFRAQNREIRYSTINSRTAVKS